VFGDIREKLVLGARETLKQKRMEDARAWISRVFDAVTTDWPTTSIREKNTVIQSFYD
jgi:hypothetical protein